MNHPKAVGAIQPQPASTRPFEGRATNAAWLLLLGTLWGTSYLFIRIIVDEVPALTLVAGRLLLAAVILWILLLASRRPVPRTFRLWAAYAVMGLFSGLVPYALISWGEQYISSGLAALLQATMPLFTVLLAGWLSSDEGLTPLRVLGVALGFAGVLVLMLPDLRQGLLQNLLGQLAVVASSLSYAASALFARRWLRHEPALVSTTGQLTMGAVFALPVSLLVDRPWDLNPSLPVLGSWLGLVILGTVLAYLIFYALLERTTATFVSTVTYIIPVNSLILGALVLGETISGTVVVSLALVLLGVLLVRS